jgi:hypothetical protein
VEDSEHSSSNLTSYEPHTTLQDHDGETYILFQDIKTYVVRMINPLKLTKAKLESVFTKETTWHYVPMDEAKVCNLLRFETMRSDSFYRLYKKQKSCQLILLLSYLIMGSQWHPKESQRSLLNYGLFTSNMTVTSDRPVCKCSLKRKVKDSTSFIDFVL